MHAFPLSPSLLHYFTPFVSIHSFYYIYFRLPIFSSPLSPSPSFSPLHLSMSKRYCRFCLMLFHGLIPLFWLFVISHYVCVQSHTTDVLFMYRMLPYVLLYNVCIQNYFFSLIKTNKKKKKNSDPFHRLLFHFCLRLTAQGEELRIGWRCSLGANSPNPSSRTEGFQLVAAVVMEEFCPPGHLGVFMVPGKSDWCPGGRNWGTVTPSSFCIHPVCRSQWGTDCA